VARGQLFSTDYIIAVGVFVLMFAACIYTWDSVVYKSQQDLALSRMSYAASRMSLTLLRTPGMPADWEDDPGSAQTLGLAVSDRVVSSGKLRALELMDYEDLKDYLGIGGFEVYINVTYVNGTQAGEAGSAPASDEAVSDRRIAVLAGEPVLVDFMVWNAGPHAGVMPVR